MAIDSRVLRVLRRLDEKRVPKLAAQLFSVNDAPPNVVSATLITARKQGLCDYEFFGCDNGRYWSLTDAGRAAIKETAL